MKHEKIALKEWYYKQYVRFSMGSYDRFVFGFIFGVLVCGGGYSLL